MMFIPKSVYYFILLLGCLVVLLRWRRLDSKIHLLFYLLVITFVHEKLRGILYKPGNIPPRENISAYIVHIYQPIETFILAAYYYLVFETKKNRSFVKIGTGIYIVFYLYYYVYQPGNFFDGSPKDFVFSGLFITIYSFLYLLELYQKDEVITLYTFPHFWIVIANLIFYSTTTIYYTFQYVILKDRVLNMQLLIIPQALNILLYSFYIIGFLCNSKARRLKLPS